MMEIYENSISKGKDGKKKLFFVIFVEKSFFNFSFFLSKYHFIGEITGKSIKYIPKMALGAKRLWSGFENALKIALPSQIVSNGFEQQKEALNSITVQKFKRPHFFLNWEFFKKYFQDFFLGVFRKWKFEMQKFPEKKILSVKLRNLCRALNNLEIGSNWRKIKKSENKQLKISKKKFWKKMNFFREIPETKSNSYIDLHRIL